MELIMCLSLNKMGNSPVREIEIGWNFALVANKPCHCITLLLRLLSRTPPTSEYFRRAAQYGAAARVGKARG
jgi:hypothetical protein